MAESQGETLELATDNYIAALRVSASANRVLEETLLNHGPTSQQHRAASAFLSGAVKRCREAGDAWQRALRAVRQA